MSEINNEKEYPYWGMCNPCGEWFKSSERTWGINWNRGRRSRLFFFGIFFTLIGIYWLGRVSGFIEYNPHIMQFIFPIMMIVFGVWFLIRSIIRKINPNGK